MHPNKRPKFAALESKNLKRQQQLFVIFKRNCTARLSIIHASIISTSVQTVDVDVRRCLPKVTETKPGISELGGR